MRIQFIMALCLSSFFIFSSCEKEGCTDENATNYSSDADIDDESCVYEGDVVFWYNSTTQTIMNLNNVTSLKYIVDGTDIGSFVTTLVWTEAPECDVEGSIGRTIPFSTNETHSVTYSIEDQNGIVRFSGNVNVSPGGCAAVKLDW